MNTVKQFYNSFNFRDMVQGDARGRPPKLLGDFFMQDLEYAERGVRPGSDVLEVGCGFGRLIPSLARDAKSVTGIDFSDLQLSQASEEISTISNARILKMHAEALEFPDKSFDVALCMNSTLGNMPGIEREVVHEMIRVTRKGGEVVLRVFADTEEVRQAQYENYARLGLTNVHNEGSTVVSDEGFYSRRFNEEDLKALFADSGLVPNVIRDSEAGFLVTAKVA